MRPLIGISTELLPDHLEGRGWFNNALLTGYADGIDTAGGIPVLLPLARHSFAREALHRLDGLILSGGLDIPSDVLGKPPHQNDEPMLPERWPSERLWFETALALDKPILGICLGMQIMGVAAGADLIQDIPTQWRNPIIHSADLGRHRHDVQIEAGTRLAALAPSLTVSITSSHHQALGEVPKGYRLAATSSDGIIEAIERPDRDFVIGVQWHPERHPDQPSWLLKAFIDHCASRMADPFGDAVAEAAVR